MLTADALMVQAGLAASTRALYQRIIDRMMRESGNPTAWFAAQVRAGRSAGTLMPLRGACKYALMATGVDEFDADRALAKPKGKAVVAREALSDAQLAQYNAAVERLSEPYRTLLLLLPLTGLRISEMCALRVSDVVRFQNDWTLRVLGKGGKTRNVPLPEAAKRVLTAFLRRESPSGALFEGTRGPVSAQSARAALHSVLTGELSHVVPHQLRHTYATRLSDRGGDLRHVQVLLGHESINTTARYTHPTEARLRNTAKLLDDK